VGQCHLDGVPFTISGAAPSTVHVLTDYDYEFEVEPDDFADGPFAPTDAMLDYLDVADWSLALDSPVEDLLVYAVFWRGDPMRGGSNTFSRTPVILSGFEKAVLNGNTLDLSADSSWGHGILLFPGPVDSLSVVTELELAGYQLMSFGRFVLDCPLAAATCQTAKKTSLTLQNKDGKTKLVAKWSGGTIADPGDPTVDTGYHLCLYEDDALVGGGAAMAFTVAPRGSCDFKPCWKTTGSGFAYKHKSLSGSGMKSVKISAKGAKSKIGFVGTPSASRMPTFPLAGTVGLRIHNSTNDECFGADFSGDAVKKSDANGFKGVASAP
jgi:hypothetical protein